MPANHINPERNAGDLTTKRRSSAHLTILDRHQLAPSEDSIPAIDLRMQRSSSSRVAAFPSTQADIAGPAPATRRRQSRKQSLLSLSECADDLQPVVMETHSVPPYRIGSKRRSKSDSAVFSVGSDIALTPKGRIKRALKGQKVHKCHCGKVCRLSCGW